MERVRAVPGVQSAGAVRVLPLATSIGDYGLDVEGYEEAPGRNAKGDWQIVTDGAFEAMGARLLRGRWFDAGDISASQPVAVVNETMARTYWKDMNDVVGGQIKVGGGMSNPMVTVVGIVADERHNGVTGIVKEKFFIPHSQWHVVTGGNLVRASFLVVRTSGEPLAVAAAVRSEVRSLDGNVPVANIRPMTEVVGAALATSRLTGFLMGVFAAIALTLAAVGIYGVLSYLVARRTQEIGIRLAIGADRTQVMLMILRQGMTLAVVGIAVGVGAAFLMSRVMQSLLYQVQPGDPGTFVVVPLVLVVVALLASALPAFKATRVNPLVALRSECSSRRTRRDTEYWLRVHRVFAGSVSRVSHAALTTSSSAWRQLTKSPGFSITAILTLGLAIGANTAVFSLVDAVMLRPLPYPQPDRLALVSLVIHRNGARVGENTSHTGAVWEAIRDQAKTVDAAVLSGLSAQVSLATGDRAIPVVPQRVSAGYFRVLGVAPAIGREFALDEDRAGGPAVALLSDRLWRAAFHADPNIVGQTIRLKGEPSTVVGVMPAAFKTDADADLWTPVRATRTGEGAGQNYGIVARLKDGVTLAQARGEMAAVADPALTRPEQGPGHHGIAWLDRAAREPGGGCPRAARSCWPVLSAWSCWSRASILRGCCWRAPAAGRARSPLAWRLAATAGMIIRQLLVESLVLAAVRRRRRRGVRRARHRGAQGVGQRPAADAVGHGRHGLSARSASRRGLTLLTTLVFGLVPALHATRLDVQAALAEGGTPFGRRRLARLVATAAGRGRSRAGRRPARWRRPADSDLHPPANAIPRFRHPPGDYRLSVAGRRALREARKRRAVVPAQPRADRRGSRRGVGGSVARAAVRAHPEHGRPCRGRRRGAERFRLFDGNLRHAGVLRDLAAAAAARPHPGTERQQDVGAGGGNQRRLCAPLSQGP